MMAKLLFVFSLIENCLPRRLPLSCFLSNKWCVTNCYHDSAPPTPTLTTVVFFISGDCEFVVPVTCFRQRGAPTQRHASLSFIILSLTRLCAITQTTISWLLEKVSNIYSFGALGWSRLFPNRPDFLLLCGVVIALLVQDLLPVLR